jgi:hypothetical protein
LRPENGSKTILVALGTLACALALAACVGQVSGRAGSTPSPAASATGAAGTGIASPVGTGTPGPATTAANGALSLSPAGSATAGIAVVATVTPSNVAVGSVMLSMALQPARHMFDQAAVVTPDPSQKPDATKSQNAGSAVFSGMVEVTNNIDPLQSVAGDSAQSILRHVVLQVKTKDRDQPVPYLSVTMDLLLDGHPVLYDQQLVPMVAADQASPSLYYGNNVRFPQRGSYQVFVRMQRNPLIGADQPPAAQFNLVLR